MSGGVVPLRISALDEAMISKLIDFSSRQTMMVTKGSSLSCSFYLGSSSLHKAITEKSLSSLPVVTLLERHPGLIERYAALKSAVLISTR